MVTGALDFRFLLLDNYKRLRINENTLATIFVIDLLLSQGNSFITAELLSMKMSLDVKEIDKILASLIVKGYLEYQVVGSKTVCSLNPLKEKLYKDFETALSREDDSESNYEIVTNIKTAVKEIQNLFKRTLSPLEKSKVKDWIMTGYKVETILEACKESISKNKKTIHAMDRILITWQTRNDIETDGITTISKDWNKSLEETIKIAKTPWLDQDEKTNK